MTSTGTRPLGAACAATYDGGVTRIVLANQEILDAPQGTWTDTVQVTLPAGEVRVLTQTIRAGAGSAYETWRDMGCPHTLSPTEELVLQAHSQPAYSVALATVPASGLSIPVSLQVNEVVVIEIRPRGESALPRGADAKAMAQWNAGMSALSR